MPALPDKQLNDLLYEGMNSHIELCSIDVTAWIFPF